MSTIPTRLRALRTERGWTLADVQERIHSKTERLLSISYLSELERHADAHATLDTLADIAQAYDMSVIGLLQTTGYAVGGPHQPEDDAYDRAFESAMSASASLGASLARFDNAIDELRRQELARRTRRDEEHAGS